MSNWPHANFPCNLAVLQSATEVIVHSEHSRALAAEWYGESATRDWHVAPLPRAAPRHLDRADARRVLGIDDNVFLVGSFGFVAPSKLTHLLLQAWHASALGSNRQCVLVLVGANHGGAYGEEILRLIRQSGRGKVKIAGWSDDHTYHAYLSAADAAVQLRCASRGETSAAALDCLNYGLATIVNANGSMAELPQEAVCMLDDAVEETALRTALERLYYEPEWRHGLSQAAGKFMAAHHRPEQCALLYAQVINIAQDAAATSQHALSASLVDAGAGAADLQRIAAAMARLPDPLVSRQLLIDVSTIARNDLRTGIERVVRAQVLALLRRHDRLRVEPVRLDYHDGRWQYRYAHAWTQALLAIDADGAPDHIVDLQAGDILFGADYTPAAVTAAAHQGLYDEWRARGVSIQFQVFDLLPVLQPHYFPEGAATVHAEWLAAIGAAASRLICISRAVAADLASWYVTHPAGTPDALSIDALHLGADFDGLIEPTASAARSGGTTPVFLMVGTIEPRKGHLQALAAFELLWQRGIDVALTIVGVEGWTGLVNAERRTIPQITTQLRRLAERAHLHWLPRVDDASLEQLYLRSACLLAPSEGEGFGLPLIEAARHRLPILARDLPVFREVGGDQMHYFQGTDPGALADAVEAWLRDYAQGRIRGSDLPWQTWASHAAQLADLLKHDPSETPAR